MREEEGKGNKDYPPAFKELALKRLRHVISVDPEVQHPESAHYMPEDSRKLIQLARNSLFQEIRGTDVEGDARFMLAAAYALPHLIRKS